MQLTFDCSIIQKLFGRAAPAVRRASCPDPIDAVARPAADDIDGVVPELTEPLADPRVIALRATANLEAKPVASLNAGGDR